jgi:DNA polymerase III delta subunit
MIYFIYGNEGKARAKAHEVIDSLQKKKPDASLFSFNSLSYDEGAFIDLVEGLGLFEQKYIVFLDNVFENKEVKESLVKKLAGMSEAEHAFVMLEKMIDKATLGKIEKKAFKVEDFSEKKDDGAPSRGGVAKFNAFDMADALGRKDKKALWVLYQKALEHDSVPEEIHGMLWWQVKAMMLAKTAKTAAEADLNPYVFSKSRSFAEKFSNDDLARISSTLVALYHDSHRGLGEFEVGLERFILSL